jgi:hypothetical protein
VVDTVEIQYFYRTRWGAHEEFIELFMRNHWPILREQLAAGRYTAVRMSTARFHTPRPNTWDILVSITYRDWAAVEAHSDTAIAERLYPDQATFKAEERHRFELLEDHWDVVLVEQTLPA